MTTRPPTHHNKGKVTQRNCTIMVMLAFGNGKCLTANLELNCLRNTIAISKIVSLTTPTTTTQSCLNSDDSQIPSISAIAQHFLQQNGHTWSRNL